jgi:hypothetical protein
VPAPSQINVLCVRVRTLTVWAWPLSPAIGFSVCRLVRTMPVRVCASAASLLPPDMRSGCRNRATCNGLIGYTM